MDNRTNLSNRNNGVDNLPKPVQKRCRKSSILGPILNQFWGLFLEQSPQGPPWGHLGLKDTFKASFLEILSPTGGPIGDPKITLGASRWPSELPRTSFGGDFLRTYFLHEIWVPKFTQKVVFFGSVDVAKT